MCHELEQMNIKLSKLCPRERSPTGCEHPAALQVEGPETVGMFNESINARPNSCAFFLVYDWR